MGENTHLQKYNVYPSDYFFATKPELYIVLNTILIISDYNLIKQTAKWIKSNEQMAKIS